MLRDRSRESEWMDDLQSSGEIIIQTLKELDYINRKLGGNYISMAGLEALAGHKRSKSVSLVDLGCGGGDILKEMAKWGRRNKVEMQLIGVDANPAIVAYAEHNCQDYPEISFQAVNIFSPDFSSQQFDIFHASLFTHHFSDDDLITLFRNCYKNCKLGIILNDLQRHWFAYYAIKSLTALFSKSPMVRNDAAVSVARGFHKRELKDIFRKLEIVDYSIRWKWAFRWQVLIRK